MVGLRLGAPLSSSTRTFLTSTLVKKPAHAPIYPALSNLSLRTFSAKSSADSNDSSTTEGEGEEEAQVEQNEGGESQEDPSEQIQALQTQITDLEKQVKEFKTAALEYKAEAYNIRLRGQKDTENARTYAIEKFAKEMLVIADNIDLAMKNVEKPGEGSDKNFKTLYEGMEMTSKTMTSVFSKFDLKKADSLGLHFDTSIHEVLYQAPKEGVDAGTIVDVVRDGYWLKNRALRSAQVGVAQ